MTSTLLRHRALAALVTGVLAAISCAGTDDAVAQFEREKMAVSAAPSMDTGGTSSNTARFTSQVLKPTSFQGVIEPTDRTVHS